MKGLLIRIIYTMAREYFDKDLFMRVEDLVGMLFNENLSGDEKRETVRKAIKREFDDIRNIVIDTIIQIVLLRKGAV